jgi:hypothetical protein
LFFVSKKQIINHEVLNRKKKDIYFTQSWNHVIDIIKVTIEDTWINQIFNHFFSLLHLKQKFQSSINIGGNKTNIQDFHAWNALTPSPRTFISAVGTAPYTAGNGALTDRKRRFTALIFTLFHRNPSVRITTAVSCYGTTIVLHRFYIHFWTDGLRPPFPAVFCRFIAVSDRLRAVLLDLGCIMLIASFCTIFVSCKPFNIAIFRIKSRMILYVSLSTYKKTMEINIG